MVNIEKANIQQSAQRRFTQIAANKQTTLEKLNMKFASADTAKSSIGFIGIICLSVLFGGVLLNDLLKLGYYFSSIHKKNNILRRSKDNKVKGTQLNEKKDKMYSKQLEDRLERMHLRLLLASKQITRKCDNSTA